MTGKGFSMVATSIFNMKLFTSHENAAFELSLLLLDTRATFLPRGALALLIKGQVPCDSVSPSREGEPSSCDP